ncbi:hypothetical protein Pmani_009180 [Petrolisthes manimaculis]|uniref:LRRCT domain-containing protein n=1 Tax=Petrolisthes manimaculis TaxID=1843537 RepID=A0AAE1Q409_9EUCA|nr:hypothetical protein Pmani_009180 [Petrolisthes manimaculis]
MLEGSSRRSYSNSEERVPCHCFIPPLATNPSQCHSPSQYPSSSQYPNLSQCSNTIQDLSSSQHPNPSQCQVTSQCPCSSQFSPTQFSNTAKCPYLAQYTSHHRELEKATAMTQQEPTSACNTVRQKRGRRRENHSLPPLSLPYPGLVVVSWMGTLLNVLIRSVYTYLLGCYHVISLLRTVNLAWILEYKLVWFIPGLKLKHWGSLYSVVMYLLVLCSFPVASEGFCPKGCSCDYINMIVNCENADLDMVPILLNPRVQVMVLSHNKIHTLSQSLIFYSELQRLDISDNRLTSLGDGNFENKNTLDELRVSANQLTTIEGASFKGLVGVKVLHLDQNVISRVEDDAFKELKSLEELNLSNNKIKNLGDNSLSGLNKLVWLDLSSNKLGNVPSAGLSNLTSLTHLDLSHNHISQVPARAFASVPALTSLILDKNNISLIDAGAFLDLTELTHLTLVDNRLLQLPSVPLSILHELRELDMSGNLFENLPTDCFQGLTSLQSLAVSRCPRLSGVSGEAFLSTGSLKKLVLSHNPRLASLPPSALTSLITLTHLDLTACGLHSLTPTQIPLQHLDQLAMGGNPLHCNCSLVWLSHLAAQSHNTTSITVDQPYCASPPALYGMLVQELDGERLGCEGGLGVWAVVICVSVAAFGLAAILIFLLCRWWSKKRKRRRRDSDEDGKGGWEGVWSPDGRLSVTRLPPTTPVNGDPVHYSPFPPPTRLGPPPRLPPDHPLHHLQHSHHQGCLQHCPYASLHPLYRPLLHPDHTSTQTSLNTPNIYEDGSSLSQSSSPLAPPLPLSDPPHWYATIGGDGGEDSGRDSRPATPLDLSNSPRKVPVTYV